ncbi:MAG: hypothetical protein ACC628_27765, partial [Pirellulaceae bacterium]
MSLPDDPKDPDSLPSNDPGEGLRPGAPIDSDGTSPDAEVHDGPSMPPDDDDPTGDSGEGLRPGAPIGSDGASPDEKDGGGPSPLPGDGNG